MPVWIPTHLAALLYLAGPAAVLQEGLEPSKAPHGPAVVFRDGRLELDLRARTLGLVLDEISQKAGLAIILAEELRDRPVSLQLHDVALDEGLRTLLAEHDVFLFYGVEEKAPSSLRAVWVYPKGRGRGLEPVPPEQWASTREIEKGLTDRDPGVRARAVEALVERKRERAREDVLRALKDEDEGVRTQALYGAVNSGLELPTPSLVEAFGDSSSDVRFLALEALAERPEAGEIASRALLDPSPHVQEKAREILSQLTVKGGIR